MLPPIFLLPFLLFALVLLSRCVRQINQWETGLIFTLGKFSKLAQPGLTLLVPFLQRLVRVDMRVRCRELPQQSVISADNVTARIDAVMYFKVVDPAKAVLNVENYEWAIRDRAKVVFRDVIGETTLDELLTHREQIAVKVSAAVEQFVAQWGIHVEMIALQDIQLPPQMQEVLAKKAIAERERQYVVIKSQADVESAQNFAKAAQILGGSPGAMELRRLEALQNLSQGTSKIIFDLAHPYPDARSAALAVSLGEQVRVAEPTAAEQAAAKDQRALPAASSTAATPLPRADDEDVFAEAPGRQLRRT